MMILRKIAYAALFAVVVPAFAADEQAPLPQKMEGTWGRSEKMVEFKLIQMVSPTTAKINIIFWDGCTRRGEATAELKDGAWSFIAPSGINNCEPITATMTRVPEQNLFRGTLESVYKGAPFTAKFKLGW